MLSNVLNYFKEMDKKGNDNANKLYKTFGNSEEYTLARLDCYEIGDKFKYDGLKYEVLNIEYDKKLITYKRLGFTFKRSIMGRKLKRYGKFGITSIMDKTLIFDK